MWDIVPVTRELEAPKKRPQLDVQLVEVMYMESLRQLSAYVQYELEEDEINGGSILPDDVHRDAEVDGVSPEVERVAEKILRDLLQDTNLSGDKSILHRAVNDAIDRFAEDARMRHTPSGIPDQDHAWTSSHSYPGLDINLGPNPYRKREVNHGRRASDLIGLVKAGDESRENTRESQQSGREAQSPAKRATRNATAARASARASTGASNTRAATSPKRGPQRMSPARKARATAAAQVSEISASDEPRYSRRKSAVRVTEVDDVDSTGDSGVTGHQYDHHQQGAGTETDNDSEGDHSGRPGAEYKQRLSQYSNLREGMSSQLDQWKRQGDDEIVNRLNQSLDRWQTRLAQASALANASNTNMSTAATLDANTVYIQPTSTTLPHDHPGPQIQHYSTHLGDVTSASHINSSDVHVEVPAQLRPGALSPNRTNISTEYPVPIGAYATTNQSASAPLQYAPSQLARYQPDEPSNVLYHQGGMTVSDVTELNLNNYELSSVMRSTTGQIGSQAPQSQPSQQYAHQPPHSSPVRDRSPPKSYGNVSVSIPASPPAPSPKYGGVLRSPDRYR